LAATVTDVYGNATPGKTVTFNPPTSGASGTFAGGVNTATTNAQGVATAAVFTANAVAELIPSQQISERSPAILISR